MGFRKCRNGISKAVKVKCFCKFVIENQVFMVNLIGRI